MRKRSWIILCLCLGFVSCSIQQKALPSQDKLSQNTENRDSLVHRILQARPNFQTARMPRAKVHFTYGKDSISCNANILLVSDSVLNISLQPLTGIEVFRIILTPEGLLVIDRINKRYAQCSNSQLKQMFNAYWDFAVIEQLFKARIDALIPDSTTLYQRLNQLETNTNTFTTRYNEHAIQYKAEFAWNGQLQNIQMHTELPSVNMQISYTEWKPFAQTKFPTLLQVDILYQQIAAGLRVSTSKIVFDEDIVASNYIHPNLTTYDKIKLTSLLQ